jgi:hypothetical protein
VPASRGGVGGFEGSFRYLTMVPLPGRCRTIPGAWLLPVILLGACGPVTSAPSSTATPAVTMRSELDARLTIGPIEPWVTTMPIYISLLTNHIPVHLTGGDTLACNGVAIQATSDDIVGYHFEGDVPRVKVGGVYECVYTHAGARAVIRAPALAGPTILSPKAGDTVARTGTLTVTYVRGTSSSVSGEINQSQGLFGGAFSTSSAQPDNGTYTMPKASGLKPGAGWIILYRSLVSAPPGTGFKSATVVDNAAATGVEVQWL